MMSKEKQLKALELIMSLNTSHTELSLGYVNSKGKCNDGLIIKNCSPIVINTLISNGYSLSMSSYGLHVDNYQ